MAIAAIDSQSGYVVLMAERNRLFRPDALIGHIGGELQVVHAQTDTSGQHRNDKKAYAGIRVRTRWKDLCHLSRVLFRDGCGFLPPRPPRSPWIVLLLRCQELSMSLIRCCSCCLLASSGHIAN